ncbi:MAG: hypothetical protein K5756_02450 [Clostridiales bacterium]|nr:hypothetical protein [Clostridiales bacterium]
MKEEFVFKKSLLGGFKRSSVIECIEKLQMEKIEVAKKIKAFEETIEQKDGEIKALNEKIAELEALNKELSQKQEEQEKKTTKTSKTKKSAAEKKAKTDDAGEPEGYYPPDISEINDKFSGKA